MFSTLKRLWAHVTPRRRLQFGMLLILSVVAALFELISVGAILPFLGVLTKPDHVFQHKLVRPLIDLLKLTEPLQLLLPITIGFAAAALIAGGVRFLTLWSQISLSHSVGADFSISMYRRTLYQPYSVHVARNSSEVIAAISVKASQVTRQTLFPIVSLFSSVLMILAILGMLLVVEPRVALLVFWGLGSLYGAVILLTRKKLDREGLRVSQEQSRVIKFLQEGLGGIRDVLIDGTQASYCAIYRNADLRLRRSMANIQIIGLGPRYGIEALGIALMAGFAYALTVRAEGLTNAIPILGLFALAAQRLLPALQQAFAAWSQIRGSQSNLGDALLILEQPLPTITDASAQKLITFNDAIELVDISFRYPCLSQANVIKNINLCIPKGQKIGFIGSTGCGKSTLLDIIMGLLNPTEGELLIDGIPIGETNRRAWQARIAHVPQAIFLSDSTIAENIAFGVPSGEIDYKMVRRAAEKAQIADTITTWDRQYETIVGERGIRLSGGQRQRIGIARALYKQASVIIFDEATSALDSDTEASVMEAIDGLGDDLTVLIVAHRITTLRNCNEVIELVAGQIKQRGTYDQILTRSVDATQ
jgi:ABC-type multidrug transport system fused ATPase/permease subunit